MKYDLKLGDCMDVMPLIPDASIDMVMADPPYGTTSCKWDSVIPLEPMWNHLKRIVKPKGAIVLTSGQPFTSALIMSNVGMFKYCWVWEKEKGVNFITSNIRPMFCHEDICVFYRKQPTFNPQMKPGKPYTKKQKTCTSGETHSWVPNPTDKVSSGGRKPTTVIRFARDMNRDKKNNHPTQKPVALMEYMINTYSDVGDVVMDFCMGSGTTGIAAMNTGRLFVGIEKEPKYFTMAEKRIKQRQLHFSF